MHIYLLIFANVVAAEDVDIIFEVSLLNVDGSIWEDFYPVFLIFLRLEQFCSELVVFEGLPHVPLARPHLFRAKKRWDELFCAFEAALFFCAIDHIFCFSLA